MVISNALDRKTVGKKVLGKGASGVRALKMGHVVYESSNQKAFKDFAAANCDRGECNFRLRKCKQENILFRRGQTSHIIKR